MITVEAAVLAIVYVPMMLTFVPAYGAVAICRELGVFAGRITIYTVVVGSPYVLAGKTAVDA
jgi:hypothetical protein